VNKPITGWRHVTAIRTLYRGVMFRSRTEARWAAFFDELGWPWEYEPHDLVYYVPDFVLKLDASPSGVLCEVKGCNSLEELRAHTAKMGDSGWEGDALIVGSGLLEIGSAQPILGLIGEPTGPLGWLEWGTARLFFCLSCGHHSVLSDEGSWRCRVCGAVDGHVGHAVGAEELWGRASNRVQWRPRKPKAAE